MGHAYRTDEVGSTAFRYFFSPLYLRQVRIPIDLWMRVRILKPSVGIVDGVSLSHLIPGLVYDLKPITANYLVSQGCARGLPASDPAIVALPDNPTFFSVVGGIRVTPPHAEDADEILAGPKEP